MESEGKRKTENMFVSQEIKKKLGFDPVFTLQMKEMSLYLGRLVKWNIPPLKTERKRIKREG